MPSHTKPEIRVKRAEAIRPLFAYLEGRGMRRTWLAQRLEIPAHRLWNYEHGLDRLPAWFIERACQVLGIPTSLIPLTGPPDLYIQPRRKESTRKQKSAKSPATTSKTTRKRKSDGQRNGDGQHRQSATRRRAFTASTASADSAGSAGSADTSESSTDPATLHEATAVDLASGLEESRA